MNDAIKDFMALLGFAADLLSLSASVNFRSPNFRSPATTLKSALADEVLIEKILHDIFLRKKVMWEKPVYEGAKECLDSLKDLQNKCDEISAQFFDRSNSTDDEQYFFSMLLRSIGSYCNDAGKDITKMGKKNISLEMILKSFRTKSYPFILLLIYSLPDSSHTKQECADKFDLGLDNSNLTLEKINPKWLIG